MRNLRTIDIVCQVLDNYGDAGVCWRLARAMAFDGLDVTLWVDDLARLQRLRPSVDIACDQQSLDGFTLRRWSSAISPNLTADLVIGAFGCRLPEATLQRMATRTPAPVWINLEYLSAEDWVERSHRVPSPHPRLPLVEYFFFPGFTLQTGGLLREPNLLSQRASFDASERAVFLSKLGVRVPFNSLLVSLFCYPTAPIESLFNMMESGPPIVCLVPEGVTLLAPGAGEKITRGALTLQGIPFLSPDDYDRLLWSCDLNFVRGEDSASRAQWAAQPMVWQLYPQHQQAHLNKLDAFMARYCAGLDEPCRTAWYEFSRWWNADPNCSPDWQAFIHALPVLKSHAISWQHGTAANRALGSALVEFAREIG
ncbi:MAG: elongation factor P maturation arginine rhamnosyltransferase EarP [Burkholderiaceae bacterium]